MKLKSKFSAEDVLAYARDEARRLSAKLSEEALVIEVTADPGLEEEETAIRSDNKGVLIRGGSAVAALHGVYTFFEKLGCVFDFSGEILPARQAALRIPQIDLRHKPSVPERGIRMHLNFVQDQSYFSEEEFASFISNMAKQRFNYLQFHMYTPLQWFPFQYRGVKHLEHHIGRDRKPLPEDMIGRGKVLVKDHWFPREFESIRDPEELLNAMHFRFKKMMARAHGLGIWNSVSMEPESLPPAIIARLPEWSNQGSSILAGGNLAQEWQAAWSGTQLQKTNLRHPLVVDINVERVLQCVDAFPDIDEIQLISCEGASWEPGPDETYEAELERLATKFRLPPETFDHVSLSKVVPPDEPYEMLLQAHPYWTIMPGKNYYGCVVSSLRMVEHALAIFADPRVRSKLADRGVRPSIAVYSPDPAVVKLMMPAISKMLPSGMSFQALADYSARDIARNLPAWRPLKEAGQTVGVISWLEFDGIMSLCEGWTDSLIENVQKAVELGVCSMSFNHWRVRSLEQNAAAAASLCWDHRQSAAEFKSGYFGRLFGEAALPRAIEAYAKLEMATEYAKQYNYNVGFCHTWVINVCTNPPGYPWHRLLTSQKNYRAAAEAFAVLAEVSSAMGREQACYMSDLCEISALHLQAVQHLQNAKLPLYGYKAWPLGNTRCCWPPPDQLRRLLQEIRSGVELEMDYMTIYSKWVRSCDEQGQLCGHQAGVIEPWTHFAEVLETQLKRSEQTLSEFDLNGKN